MKYKIVELTNKILENYSGLYKTLSNLSESPKISHNLEKEILENVNNQNSYIYVAVMEGEKKIIGTSTILIEQKFIGGGKKVGHIEDIAVQKKYEGKSVGKNLINMCSKRAKEENCYKIILNCNKNLINFYSKNNFYESGIHMRSDL